MKTRLVGLLAVVGGSGLTIMSSILLVVTLSTPGVRPWEVKSPFDSALMAVAGNSGIVALAVATVGLVFAFQDRISSGGALAGSIGAVGGIVGLMGAYSFLLALPVCSAIVVWDLARARVLRSWLAAAHVASAVGFAVLIASYLTNTPLGAATVVAVLYPLTWLAIGGSVLRGLPEPMAPRVRPDAHLS